MAVYTMTIRTILDNVDNGFPNLLTMNSYPIYDETHRTELNTKICNHYMYREIGFETVAMFYDRLQVRLREVMPYYNELYASAAMTYNPLLTDDYTLTRTEEGSNTLTGSTTSTTSGETSASGTTTISTTGSTTSSDSRSTTITDDGKTVASDTPQAMLDRDIDDPGWATGASFNENTKTDSGTSSGETSAEGSETRSYSDTGTSSADSSGSSEQAGTVSNEITETRTGRQGRAGAELIKAYRDAILNVDMMVIASLADLFMNIY